jgi:hypothetical protein
MLIIWYSFAIPIGAFLSESNWVHQLKAYCIHLMFNQILGHIHVAVLEHQTIRKLLKYLNTTKTFSGKYLNFHNPYPFKIPSKSSLAYEGFKG